MSCVTLGGSRHYLAESVSSFGGINALVSLMAKAPFSSLTLCLSAMDTWKAAVIVA